MAEKKGNNDQAVDISTEGWEDFIPTVGLRAQGFWNARPEYKGKVLQGILVGEVLVDGKGEKVENPFYLFKLLAPLECWIKPSREETEKGAKERLGTLDAGDVVGVSRTAALNGIMRKLGHGFKIRYDGKRQLENGKSIHEFKFKTSPKPLANVERGDSGKPTAANLPDEKDEEIPF